MYINVHNFILVLLLYQNIFTYYVIVVLKYCMQMSTISENKNKYKLPGTLPTIIPLLQHTFSIYTV